MQNIKYRPDIDGLRAIAVVGVLLHHINDSVLPGGFVGVDIFFVISGFLITSQIYSEALSGAFSLKRFYKRRINRIAPALLVVVFVCFLSGTLLLSPADFSHFSVSGLLSSMGLSNFYFWHEYKDYFAGDSKEAILLHTWSLGVEEQFYALWPLFILLLVRITPRHLPAILLVLTLLAVAASEYGAGVSVSASYYLLPTRVFELMIGGFLATALMHKRPHSKIMAQLCTVTGLSLLVYAFAMLNRGSHFPGLNALYPCIGTALLLWAGANGSASGLLTNKVMVFLGLISYSLYLWHWPILAYLRYMDVSIGPWVGSSAVVASILMAWLSWRYVEQPFRHSGADLTFRRVFLARFLAPACALLLIGTIIVHSQGFPRRFDPMVQVLETDAAAKPDALRAGCHVPTALYRTPPDPGCRLGTKKSVIDGILIGDSYANHFTGMIDVLAKADGISIMDYTMAGCLPVLGYTKKRSETYRAKCAARNKFAFDYIERRGYRYVVLAGSWPRADDAGPAIESTLTRLIAGGAQVIVILSNPKIRKGARCPIRQLMFHSTVSCSVEQPDKPSYWEKIRKHFGTIHFIDPMEVICTDGTCSPTFNNTLLYRDDTHLNDVGSRLIGYCLLKRGHSLLLDGFRETADHSAFSHRKSAIPVQCTRHGFL